MLVDHRSLTSHRRPGGELGGYGIRTSSSRNNRSDLVGKLNGLKAILNGLTIHYGDRLAA